MNHKLYKIKTKQKYNKKFPSKMETVKGFHWDTKTNCDPQQRHSRWGERKVGLSRTEGEVKVSCYTQWWGLMMWVWSPRVYTSPSPCLIKSTFPLTAAPCSHTGAHACRQNGIKSKNRLTQTEGRPRVHTDYITQNNDRYVWTVIILYKYIMGL